MKFTLPKLPYSYDALEPYIDKQTMEIHHLKHHQSYTDKLNDALAKHPEVPEQDAAELVANLSALPTDIQTIVRNQGGGYVNHNLFWQLLSPAKTILSDSPLQQEIVTKFKGYEQFVASFSAQAAAHFGSGWAWLVVDGDDQLQILSTPNQDSPLTQGHTPILALDLWEHAYYLKYQNRRPEYVDAFWSVVNWPVVNEKYQQALQH
jgi:Fe-Mn family superoxide dismutase